MSLNFFDKVSFKHLSKFFVITLIPGIEAFKKEEIIELHCHTSIQCIYCQMAEVNSKLDKQT